MVKSKEPMTKAPKKSYSDKKGRVWVPNDKMHGERSGEPGWDVQVDGGKTISTFVQEIGEPDIF